MPAPIDKAWREALEAGMFSQFPNPPRLKSPTVLRLPIPPSVNALFYNRQKRGKRGRGKTVAYRSWLIEADRWYLMQKRTVSTFRDCKCAVQIRIPPSKADIDNKIKAVIDYLVSREITGDDRNNLKVSIEASRFLDCCEVTIISIPPQSGS